MNLQTKFCSEPNLVHPRLIAVKIASHYLPHIVHYVIDSCTSASVLLRDKGVSFPKYEHLCNSKGYVLI